jgi:hypothetical protein
MSSLKPITEMTLSCALFSAHEPNPDYDELLRNAFLSGAIATVFSYPYEGVY